LDHFSSYPSDPSEVRPTEFNIYWSPGLAHRRKETEGLTRAQPCSKTRLGKQMQTLSLSDEKQEVDVSYNVDFTQPAQFSIFRDFADFLPRIVNLILF
jgi:hypothetical protein